MRPCPRAKAGAVSQSSAVYQPGSRALITRSTPRLRVISVLFHWAPTHKFVAFNVKAIRQQSVISGGINADPFTRANLICS